MPPIFYRFEPSLLERHVAQWEAGDYELRALAWNIRYDHRVGRERERALAAALDQLEDPPLDVLRAAIVRYYRSTIKGAAEPSFLRENEANSPNAPSGALHPSHSVGTILDLTACATAIAEARRQGNPVFKDFRVEDQIAYRQGGRGAGLWNSYLDRKFWEAVPDQQLTFLDDLFYVLHSLKWHPVWVTDWERLEPLLGRSQTRCMEVLGMPRSDAPRILIALKYGVRDAGLLVRPCQLDAGDNVYHYPSPPSRPLRDGGATMDLLVPGDEPKLVPEYIHAQVLFRREFWQAAEYWRLKTATPIRCDLAGARRQHQMALSAAYGRHAPPWLEEF